MGLRGRKHGVDFFEHFVGWTSGRTGASGCWFNGLETFKVDGANVVSKSDGDSATFSNFAALFRTRQVSGFIFQYLFGHIKHYLTIPGSNIIEQGLNCICPIFVRSIFQPREFEHEMTEHVTQNRRSWGFGPWPLPQIFVRDGMICIERQPVGRQLPNFAKVSPFCKMETT